MDVQILIIPRLIIRMCFFVTSLLIYSRFKAYFIMYFKKKNLHYFDSTLILTTFIYFSLKKKKVLR